LYHNPKGSLILIGWLLDGRTFSASTPMGDLYGMYQWALILSVRTRSQEHTAEKLVQAIVAGEGSAGGHGTVAGGQIPLGDRCAEQEEVLLLSQPRIAASGNPAGGRR
jgi:hypothetical protein